MSENLVPKLRFKEFSDEWGKYFLGEVIESFESGHTPSRNNDNYWNGDISWISSGELNYNHITSSIEQITPTGMENANLRLLPSGTFLMAIFGLEAKGTRGSCAILDIESTISQACMALFPDKNKLLTKFLYYWYLNVGELYGIKYTQGTKQQNYNKELLEKLPITLPNIQEQEKIADFLSKINHKIELLEQKYQHYQEFKKYLMQQIFAQKLRFKGFEDEWKYISAGEIFKNVTNKNHDGTLPILAVTQDKGVVYRDSLDMEIKTSQNSVKTYKLIEPGDFVISLRSFQGGIEYSYIEGICSPAYTILKPKIEICDGFYKFYFKKDEFISRLNYAVIGIRDGKQISYKDFSEIKIPYTSVKEQKKIADFLSNIDKKIKIIQSQLLEIKEFKKGLLQQMFI